MAQALAPAYAAYELPPDDWYRLAHLPLAHSLPDPGNATILVVEHDGAIIAAWVAMTTIHLEGCFIAPEHRKKPGAVRAMIEGMSSLLADRGIPQVVTVTQTPEVGELAQHLGGTRLGDLWMIPVPFAGVR